MDQQLKVGDPNQDKVSDHEVSEAAISVSEEGNIDYELHPDANSEFSGAAALEQRRAHKLEIQVYHLALAHSLNLLLLYTLCYLRYR